MRTQTNENTFLSSLIFEVRRGGLIQVALETNSGAPTKRGRDRCGEGQELSCCWASSQASWNQVEQATGQGAIEAPEYQEGREWAE